MPALTLTEHLAGRKRLPLDLPVESVFSALRAALAGYVHAVTPRGFDLKVSLTALAYSILA